MAKNNGRPKHDWRRQAREIADSLAIAFILAMVIRHFVLEVFKIPTKSMQPTLLGDPWTGDKILVNKFAFDFGEPDRWDVIVFKFPDNVSKNYIKRVVGLPGEQVWVRDGDVYIDGDIARKPWPVQNALWRRRRHSGQVEFQRGTETIRVWRADAPEYWNLVDHRFEVDCQHAQEPQYLEYSRLVVAYEEEDFRESHSQYRSMPTSDVMVQFALEPLALAGDVRVVFDVETSVGIAQRVDYWMVRLPLGSGPQKPEILRSGKPTEAALGSYEFREGEAALVQVCNVDRTIIVRVDGQEVAYVPYDPVKQLADRPGYPRGTQVLIGSKQGHVVFHKPGLYADVYYTNYPFKRAVHEPYQIGDDEYFVLGDNSCNSNDSRGWDKRGAVPRSYLVGEAFLVLWPLGRMKIVR